MATDANRLLQKLRPVHERLSSPPSSFSGEGSFSNRSPESSVPPSSPSGRLGTTAHASPIELVLASIDAAESRALELGRDAYDEVVVEDLRRLRLLYEKLQVEERRLLSGAGSAVFTQEQHTTTQEQHTTIQEQQEEADRVNRALRGREKVVLRQGSGVGGLFGKNKTGVFGMGRQSV